MSSEEPWARYDKAKLSKGWSYPVSRDEVFAALVSAGAVAGSLSFSRTEGNFEGQMVLHSYWPSDARSQYLDVRPRDWTPLMMLVSAVPSELRQRISEELKDNWLDQAAEWAAKAPMRGNAWTASDRYWILRYTESAGLTLEES